MLRAGKKIQLDKDQLISVNGMILSPVINLCDLILRADRPVPIDIKNFLESRNVKIERIIYKDEWHIQLSGHYELNKTDIKKFIQENESLTNEQYIDLDNVPVAVNLQNEIGEKLHAMKIGAPLTGIYDSTQYSISGGILFSENQYCEKVGMDSINMGRCGSNNEMQVLAKKIHNTGTKTTGCGFFAERSAFNNMLCDSETGVQNNAVLDAGNTLSITSTSDNRSTETLSIEPNLEWFNNPHKSDAEPRNKQENVSDLLEEAECLLFHLRR